LSALYITGQYLCFINTAGDIKVELVVIVHSQKKELIAFVAITEINKNATKMNTSIEIVTQHNKWLFSFFLMRDKTLNMITTVWKNVLQYDQSSSSILARKVKFSIFYYSSRCKVCQREQELA
jgi:hypothetical protein